MGSVLVSLLVACAGPPPPPPPPDIDWKAELSRHGEWLVVAPYGRVWHPSTHAVGADFAPYLSGGNWSFGAEGWVFDSPWSWGALAFHYGRWFLADDLGWLFVPDQIRGPAWVEWREGDGHIGWAPLPPPVKHPRSAPRSFWYVKAKHFSARDLPAFLLKPEEAAQIHTRTLPRATGPDPEQLRPLGGLDRHPPPPDSVPVVAPDLPVEAQPTEVAPRPPAKKKVKKRLKAH